MLKRVPNWSLFTIHNNDQVLEGYEEFAGLPAKKSKISYSGVVFWVEVETVPKKPYESRKSNSHFEWII